MIGFAAKYGMFNQMLMALMRRHRPHKKHPEGGGPRERARRLRQMERGQR